MTKSDLFKKLQDKLVWVARKVLWEGESWGTDLGELDAALWFVRDGWTMAFSESEAREYRAAVKELTRFDPLKASYSTRNLIAGWQGILVDLARNNYKEQPPIDELQEEVQKWLDRLRAATEQTITYYTVIDNLKAAEARHVGRVLFSPLTEELEKQIKDGVLVSLGGDTGSSETPEQPPEPGQLHMLRDFSVATGNSVASVGIVVRDMDRGKELALDAIEESLHLLRYLGNFATGRLPSPIGIQGTVGEGRRIIPAFSSGKVWKLYGEIVAFPLRWKDLAWGRTEFVELEAILRKTPEERDELENKLIGALMWLGQSVDEVAETARFLKTWIGMEMLLKNELAPITIVGERMAFLLGNCLEDRREIVRTMKKISNVRNTLVHTGQVKNDEDVVRYLPYATALAARALHRVVELRKEHGWTEFSQLKEHIERLKYG